MEIEKGGQRVYQVSFMAIAEALGLGKDWRPLLQAATEPVTQAKPSEALPRTVAVPVTLILSPDTHINETTPHEAIAAFLTTYLNLKYEVTITAVKKGSIIVELELSEEDLLRLVAAFTETRLDAIHVDAIRLPATTGPLAAGLLQIIEPTGTPADEMTDPVTPEMTLTRTPAKSLPFSVDQTNPDQEATDPKKQVFPLRNVFKGLAIIMVVAMTTFIVVVGLLVYSRPTPVQKVLYQYVAGMSVVGMIGVMYIIYIFFKYDKDRRS